MSDEEVMEMVIALVEMSEENFQKCVKYVEDMEVTDKTREFFNELIRITAAKRKKLSVTQG